MIDFLRHRNCANTSGKPGCQLPASKMTCTANARAQISTRDEHSGSGHHLRHSKFTGLREDKDARTVIKEHGGEGGGLLSVAKPPRCAY